jgi:hypothetical protein
VRLREIERAYRHPGRETEADVSMVHEPRRSREALLASSPVART